jgi:hypothetical protein
VGPGAGLNKCGKFSLVQNNIYYTTRHQAGCGSISVSLFFRCSFYLMVNRHLNTMDVLIYFNTFKYNLDHKKPLKNTRIKLYNTLALQVLSYGSETWTVKARLVLITNFMHNFIYSLIIYITLRSSTCFEHRCAHLQEDR